MEDRRCTLAGESSLMFVTVTVLGDFKMKNPHVRRVRSWLPSASVTPYVLGVLLFSAIAIGTATAAFACSSGKCCWYRVDKCQGCYRWIADNYIWLGSNFEYKCNPTSQTWAVCTQESLQCWYTAVDYPVYYVDDCGLIHHWNQGPAWFNSQQCTLFTGDDTPCPWT